MSKYRSKHVGRLAAWLKALSHPNRLCIFLRLVRAGRRGATCCTLSGSRCCVGELGQGLGIGASTLSHHLKELRQAGLIVMQRQGQSVECWAADEPVHELATFFSSMMPATDDETAPTEKPTQAKLRSRANDRRNRRRA